MRITDLSRESGIPKTKIYQVVKSLKEKDLIEVIRLKPYRVLARDPIHVISEKIRSRCERLNERKKVIIEILKKVGKVSVESVSEIASIKILEGEKELISYLRNDIRDSRKRIIATVSKTPVEFDWISLIRDLVEALSRGSRFIYIAPGESMSKKIIANIIRSLVCGEKRHFLEDLVRDSINQVEFVDRAEYGSYRDLIDRVELYELDLEAPFIVIDDRIVYNLFTEPVYNKIMFSIRYENERFAKTLIEYLDLLKISKNSRNIIDSLKSNC